MEEVLKEHYRKLGLLAAEVNKKKGKAFFQWVRSHGKQRQPCPRCERLKGHACVECGKRITPTRCLKFNKCKSCLKGKK